MSLTLRRQAFFYVAGLVSLLLPLIAFLAPLGMAPTLILLGLVGLLAAWKDKPWRRFGRGLGLWLLAVVVWGGVSSIFAIDTFHSARVAASFAVMALLGFSLHDAVVGLTARQWKICILLMMGGQMAMFLLMALDITSCGAFLARPHYGVEDVCKTWRFVYKRGLTALVISTLPVFAAVERMWPSWRVRLVMACVCAVMLWMAVWVETDTLLIGIIVSVIVVSLMVILPSLILKVGKWACVALVILVPLAAAQLPVPGQWAERGEDNISSSLHHRLTIWHFSAQRLMEKPFLGWGMDAARDMPGGEERFVLTADDLVRSGHTRRYEEQYLPLHPHNLVLQWWLELGVLGGVLLIGLVFELFASIHRVEDSLGGRAILAATVSLVIFVSLASFGAWQSWWLSTIWITGALVAPRPGR